MPLTACDSFHKRSRLQVRGRVPIPLHPFAAYATTTIRQVKPVTQPSAPEGSNPFAMVLRRALWPTALAGVLTALVLGVVNGLDAGLAGLLGAVVATGFFGSGMLVVSRVVRDTSNPLHFMAVGMAVYLAQVIGLLFVLILARRSDSLDSVAAGIAMLVSVIVWQVAQVLAWRSARVPVYDQAAQTATADPVRSTAEGRR